jgi:hypothetical protein
VRGVDSCPVDEEDTLPACGEDKHLVGEGDNRQVRGEDNHPADEEGNYLVADRVVRYPDVGRGNVLAVVAAEDVAVFAELPEVGVALPLHEGAGQQVASAAKEQEKALLLFFLQQRA